MPEAETGLGEALRKCKQILIGKPFESSREKSERLSKVQGLAVLGADNISSSVYGPEAMMRALAVGGIGALAFATHVSFAILLLLSVVAISYQQTIRAYPSGGGSYIVTKDNLGLLPGLVSGCALMIDYVLDVAVSVTAGAQSLTSVFPGWSAHKILLCLGLIAILMIGNLRGIRSSGLLFSVPIYLYLLTMAILVSVGVWKTAAVPAPRYLPTPEDLRTIMHPAAAIGPFLILRSFASGAVALTGIEAIANGVPAFRPPETRNARITLVWMASIFSLIFLGLAYLAGQMQVLPDPSEVETLVSRIARTVFGRNWIFVTIQLTTALILAIAANTAYADFPRLASFMAKDGFLPVRFTERGERLAFDRGILTLSIVSALLVIAFRGSLEALIPLFTVGVFIAFTLSEASMVVHHRRTRERGWRWGIAVNGIGAVVTGLVALIEGGTKFLRGAWIVLFLVPVMAALFSRIRAHFQWVRQTLRIDSFPGGIQAALKGGFHHHILIPVDEINKATLQAIVYAKSLVTPDQVGAVEATRRITAVHVSSDPREIQDFKSSWKRAGFGIPLIVLESPYRELLRPLLAYIDVMREAPSPRKSIITILVPELIPSKWLHQLLHRKTALILRAALYLKPHTAVLSLPYHLSQ